MSVWVGISGLVLNTCACTSVTSQPLSCSLPPQDATFFNRLKMELTPTEFPWEYTPWVCISALHMNKSHILYWGKSFFYAPPYTPMSVSHSYLALWRPWQFTTGGRFFKVKTLTFTNRDGPQPRLPLTICVSPYWRDAFMPQTAWEAD